MRYLLLLLLLGCSMHRTTMKGTVDNIDGEWVAVEVINENDAKTWVKLNKQQFRSLKEGDKVVFILK